jgi:hypothetical protein
MAERMASKALCFSIGGLFVVKPEHREQGLAWQGSESDIYPSYQSQSAQSLSQLVSASCSYACLRGTGQMLKVRRSLKAKLCLGASEGLYRRRESYDPFCSGFNSKSDHIKARRYDAAASLIVELLPN